MNNLRNILNFGPLLIIIAAILWALDGVVRRNLYSLPPLTIVFVEHVIGSIILLPFLYNQLKHVKLTRKELSLIAFVALFSSVLGTLWFTTALLKVAYIPFSVVFLIQKLQPLFAIVTAVLFLKEKITVRYMWWALLALCAAYFVTFPDGTVNLATGTATAVAALYALGAAFAWGSSTTLSKIALTGKPDKVVAGLRFIFATIFSGIGLVVFGYHNSLSQITIPQLGQFIFIALSTGMVALLIYYKGLQKTDVKVSTILELTFPLLAVIIDIFLYKTVLQPSQYIAAIVLVLAMYGTVTANKSV